MRMLLLECPQPRFQPFRWRRVGIKEIQPREFHPPAQVFFHKQSGLSVVADRTRVSQGGHRAIVATRVDVRPRRARRPAGILSAMPNPSDSLWSPGRRALTIGLILNVTIVASEALAVGTILPIVAVLFVAALAGTPDLEARVGFGPL